MPKKTLKLRLPIFAETYNRGVMGKSQRSGKSPAKPSAPWHQFYDSEWPVAHISCKCESSYNGVINVP